MNYPYNWHIIHKILCKWTCQTCFSGEWLKIPWASCLYTNTACYMKMKQNRFLKIFKWHI